MPDNDNELETGSPSLLTLTGLIVESFVGNNRVPTAELPTIITSVADALGKLGQPEPEAAPEKPKGAVGVRKSLADPAHIISMIDGKPYKTLKRHIARHGYDEHSYREAFDLPRDYPMVAAEYSEHRRNVAKSLGLGRRKAEPAPVEASKRRGRPKKA